MLVMRRSSKLTLSNKVQLIDCKIAPSIWLVIPSGLTTRPASTAATARTMRVAGFAFDLHLAGDGAIGGKVLVVGKGEAAAAARQFTARSVRPAEPLRDGGNHVASARIIEMLQAKLHRIGAGRRRQFVHEAFDGKYVHMGA